MKGITGAEENEDFYPASTSGEDVSCGGRSKTGVCGVADASSVLRHSCVHLLRWESASVCLGKEGSLFLSR